MKNNSLQKQVKQVPCEQPKIFREFSELKASPDNVDNNILIKLETSQNR